MTTKARLIYITFFLLWTLATFVLLLPGVNKKIIKSNFVKNSFHCENLDVRKCSELISYELVCRLFLVTVFYHFVLTCLFVFKVPRCTSFLEYLHNHCWIFKLMFLLALTASSLYIPQQSGFIQYFSFFALVGSVLFVLFQFCLFLDLAEFVVSRAMKARENEMTKHQATTKVVTVFIIMKSFELFGMSFGVVGFVLVTSSPGDCIWNGIFIMLNLGACFIAFGISLHPQIRTNLSPAVVFLPCAVITFHSVFVLCFALSSQTDERCNLEGTFLSATNLPIGLNLRAIFSCIVMFVALFYEGLRDNKDSYVLNLLSCNSLEWDGYKINDDEDSNEIIKPNYSYSAFHCRVFTSSLYALVSITNWYGPVYNQFSGNKGAVSLEAHWKPALIANSLASFLPVLIYISVMICSIAKHGSPIFQTRARSEDYTAIRQSMDKNEYEILSLATPHIANAYHNTDETVDFSAACSMLTTTLKIRGKRQFDKENDLVVKCRKIRDTSLTYFHFPAEICQSYYGGRNGSNACTIISVLIARAFCCGNLSPQQTGRLSEDWINLFSGCIAEGNMLYDLFVKMRKRGVIYLSVEDVVEEFGDKLQVQRLGCSLPVSYVSETETATVYFQLERLRRLHQRQAVIFIKDYRSGVFLFTKDGLLLYADSHPYGSGGAVLVCTSEVRDLVLLLIEVLRVVSLEGLGSLTPISFYHA